jgi:hypothetical protein
MHSLRFYSPWKNKITALRRKEQSISIHCWKRSFSLSRTASWCTYSLLRPSSSNLKPRTRVRIRQGCRRCSSSRIPEITLTTAVKAKPFRRVTRAIHTKSSHNWSWGRLKIWQGSLACKLRAASPLIGRGHWIYCNCQITLWRYKSRILILLGLVCVATTRFSQANWRRTSRYCRKTS